VWCLSARFASAKKALVSTKRSFTERFVQRLVVPFGDIIWLSAAKADEGHDRVFAVVWRRRPAEDLPSTMRRRRAVMLMPSRLAARRSARCCSSLK
jgi:hypothetical protein